MTITPDARTTFADARAILTRHPAHNIPSCGTEYVFGRVHPDRLSATGYRMELGKGLRAIYARMKGKTGAKHRFVVIARPRSGTTLLVTLLHQIPDLRCDGEMLHHAVLRPTGLLRSLARTCQQSAYGCKVLSYQMLDVQRMADPLAFCQSVQAAGFHIVHLTRDTFGQCLSLSKAQHTGFYHQKSETPVSTLPSEMTLDEDVFRQQVHWNLTMLDYENKLLAALPHLSLHYDTDLTTPEAQQRSTDKICDRIGHSSGLVQARTKKVDTMSGGTRITNRDRLKDIASEMIADANQKAAKTGAAPLI